MKEMPLSRGYVALVDDSDYDLASQYKWYASLRTRSSGVDTIYAVRTCYETKPRSSWKLHRFLLGITDPAIGIDHEDGNGLNCQRYNLRVDKDHRNQCNRGPQKNNKSGYKGVHWSKSMNKWHPMINSKGVKMHLGYYDSPEEAALVYDAAAAQLHGDFARVNFPSGLVLEVSA